MNKAKSEQNKIKPMRLYCWKPDSHGPVSFYVMARSKRKAKKYVSALVDRIQKKQQNDIGSYYVDEWGTKEYKLSVASPGEVLINYND